MSFRGSGGYRSRNDEGSVFGGGSAGGPPLQVLIIGTVVLGVVALLTVIIFTNLAGGTQQTATGSQQQPQVLPTAAPEPTAAPAPTEAPAVEPAAGGGGGSLAAEGTPAESVTILPEAMALAFADTAVTLPADTLVTVTLDNQNQLGVQHNWVLVDGGADVAAAVNTAAQGNADGLYVPPADTEGALAYTAMINAGEQGSVTFQTPASGTYLFICTFPGHYLAGMQGELTVN
ncbi:MAG: auracyanin [Oscillochloris sp.]|nr:auracyanin [Oscillochloris sp.]